MRRLRVSRLKANCARRLADVAGDPLEPLEARLRGALRALDDRPALVLVGDAAPSATSPSASLSAQASAIASSIASFVPEPIEKCAVCAASPSSTTFSWRQCSLRTVWKFSHFELLATSVWPPSMLGEQLAAERDASSSFSPGAKAASSVASKPARRQVASSVSTMKVLIVSS